MSQSEKRGGCETLPSFLYRAAEEAGKNKKQELALVTVITLWLYNSNILPGLINIHLQHLNHLHSRSCRLNISLLQKWSRITVTNALVEVTLMSYLFFYTMVIKKKVARVTFCFQPTALSGCEDEQLILA